MVVGGGGELLRTSKGGVLEEKDSPRSFMVTSAAARGLGRSLVTAAWAGPVHLGRGGLGLGVAGQRR